MYLHTYVSICIYIFGLIEWNVLLLLLLTLNKASIYNIENKQVENNSSKKDGTVYIYYRRKTNYKRVETKKKKKRKHPVKTFVILA